MGLSSNSCRSQLLQLCFGHPGGEWFPWGSSRKSVVEPWGEPRSTTALALCWAIPCVGITILGKLLLKWMSSSMAIVILCRDGANFSKAHHLLCLGDSSPLLSTTWYNLVTVVSAQPGRNEGLYPGLCSAFASRPETSHPFQLQGFFLCTVGEFSTGLSVSVKQSILPFCLAFYYVNAV